MVQQCSLGFIECQREDREPNIDLSFQERHQRVQIARRSIARVLVQVEQRKQNVRVDNQCELRR